jgi:hypothetical protein
MRIVIPRTVPVVPSDHPQTIRLSKVEPEHSYGRDNYRWRIAVEPNGGELTEFTTARLGESSRARMLFEAFAGRPLSEGDEFDTEDLIGRTCEAIIGVKDNGHAKIVSARPLDAASEF